MRYTKKDIDKFLSRPMGLVCEFKTPMTFVSDVLREIDVDKEAFSRKHKRVIFIGGKAFVNEPIFGKKVR
jgi:hypothetical protein